MSGTRGRLGVSAEGKKNGITLLVPRPIIEQEQKELIACLTASKQTDLLMFLRRGGIRHLDVNEVLRRGEYKGYCPLHVAVLCGTSMSVSAMLELADCNTEVQTRSLSPCCFVMTAFMEKEANCMFVR